MSLKTWYESLPSDQQLKVKRAATAGTLISLCYGIYLISDRSAADAVAPPPTKREITLGTKDLLEDDIKARVNKDITLMGESLNQANKRVETLEDQLSTYNDLLDQVKKEQDAIRLNPQAASIDPTKAPPPAGQVTPAVLDGKVPPPPAGSPFPPPPAVNQFASAQMLSDQATKVAPTFIGGIGRVSGEKAATPETKKKSTIYMPPSFMPAVLLTGIHALTSQNAAGQPEPVLIRVQAPAQLPNSLKTNLKGCFIIGNSVGNLAQERVDIQLVSLSCLSLNGDAVIDATLQGFVVDSDGVRGLSGNIVTKQGALVARSFVAGVFSGIGNTVSQSSQTVSSSPLGTTTTVDPNKAVQAGIGTGIASGAEKISDLFLEYAKQSSPVIEVGTSKKITVVIQKGVDLEILDKQV